MVFDDFYFFSKVVENSSYSKASEYLNVPKSLLSRRVSELENKLGVQLIHRSTRSFKLTPAGLDLYKKITAPIKALEDSQREMIDFQKELIGTIRLTAPEDLSRFFLIDIISRFMDLNPKIKFDVYSTGRKVDFYKEPIDLGLRVGKLSDSSLISKKLGEIKNIIVASPKLLLKYKKIETFDDLATLPIIGFGELGKVKDWVLYNEHEYVHFKTDYLITTNVMDGIIKCAIDGLGVALLPSILVQKSLESGELTHIFKSYVTPGVPVHFVMPNKKMPARVRQFIDFAAHDLQKHFQ